MSTVCVGSSRPPAADRDGLQRARGDVAPDGIRTRAEHELVAGNRHPAIREEVPVFQVDPGHRLVLEDLDVLLRVPPRPVDLHLQAGPQRIFQRRSSDY